MHLEQSDADNDSLNLMSTKEDDFEKLVNYYVRDMQTSPDCENRAENSLPRNLELKASKATPGVRINQILY